MTIWIIEGLVGQNNSPYRTWSPLINYWWAAAFTRQDARDRMQFLVKDDLDALTHAGLYTQYRIAKWVRE